MKTYMANPTDIERKWYVVDATGSTHFGGQSGLVTDGGGHAAQQSGNLRTGLGLHL